MAQAAGKIKHCILLSPHNFDIKKAMRFLFYGNLLY
jgi:hypothetical protein